METVICAFTKNHLEDKKNIPASFDYTYKDGNFLSKEDLSKLKSWKHGKWPSGPVTYQINKKTYDIEGLEMKKAVHGFFGMVEPFAKNITFHHSRLPDPDIPIRFKTDDDFLRADGRKNVIAYTTMPVGKNPRNMSFDNRAIVFDDEEDWTMFGRSFLDPSRNPNFPNTIYRSESIMFTGAHELFHKLGLPHGQSGLMYPYVPNDALPLIDKETESRIYQIYGKPNFFIRKLNRMRRWRMSRYKKSKIIRYNNFWNGSKAQ